jgi:type IV pilus assembly protein PilC
MPSTYAYEVRDRQGKLVTGTLDGESEAAVVGKLRQMGYIVVNIKEKAEKSFNLSLRGLKRIKSKDLTVFSRQFATMINSGLSLTKSLNILGEQTQNSKLAKVITEIKQDVEGGRALSEALSKHTKVFPPIFISMVRAGETGGILDEVLMRIAEHFEKESALRSRIRSAMAYPVAMFAFCMIIVFIMITFVVPIFVKMFSQLGGTLPLPTRILLLVSDVIRKGFVVWILAMVGGFYGFKKYGATEKGRFNIDSIKLKLPVFGQLTRKIAIARFTRTFGTLVSSGVSILQALEIVGEAAGNAVVARAVKQARTSIKEGDTIANPLSQNPVFPPMVVHMISVGEETGSLDGMLNKIADFYDEEVAAVVESLTAMIEPLLIMVMGTLLGFIVVSLYMPMFQVITLLK